MLLSPKLTKENAESLELLKWGPGLLKLGFELLKKAGMGPRIAEKIGYMGALNGLNLVFKLRRGA